MRIFVITFRIVFSIYYYYFSSFWQIIINLLLLPYISTKKIRHFFVRSTQHCKSGLQVFEATMSSATLLP